MGSLQSGHTRALCAGCMLSVHKHAYTKYPATSVVAKSARKTLGHQEKTTAHNLMNRTSKWNTRRNKRYGKYGLPRTHTVFRRGHLANARRAADEMCGHLWNPCWPDQRTMHFPCKVAKSGEDRYLLRSTCCRQSGGELKESSAATTYSVAPKTTVQYGGTHL
jgi:hypothetical protein